MQGVKAVVVNANQLVNQVLRLDGPLGHAAIMDRERQALVLQERARPGLHETLERRA